MTLNNKPNDEINGTEDEDSKTSWHQRLLKSASGVLSHRRDSSSETSEPRLQQHQCVEQGAHGGEEAEAEEHCCTLDETYPSTSVSTSMQTSINLDHLTLHQRLMLALSLMVILHAMIANL